MAATAQSNQQSTAQRVTIIIQKTTLLDLSIQNVAAKEKAFSNPNQFPARITRKNKKQIILAAADDQTYVKKEKEEEGKEAPIEVITTTVL